MKSYWVSWWHKPSKESSFELHSPWWFSGFRPKDGASSICAAVKANSMTEAKEIIRASYDVRPTGIEWRFVERKLADWTPFNGRFQQASWMQWS